MLYSLKVFSMMKTFRIFGESFNYNENGEYKNSGTISNSAEASNINLKGNGVENYSNLVLDFFN